MESGTYNDIAEQQEGADLLKDPPLPGESSLKQSQWEG